MSQAIRVMIADDDVGMRLVLRKIIEKNDTFSVVGEASNGEEAIAVALAVEPDVVFLDIEMPGLTGLECAKRISAMNPNVAILFATAHDEFMSDAFEVYAYDYLIKPFKTERVLQTLARIASSISEDHVLPKRVTTDRLTIKNREGLIFIQQEDIIFIERTDRISTILTIRGEYQTSESLNDLEQRLNPQIFLRSHRSYLINKKMVQRAIPYGRWSYSLEFANTDKVALITHDKLESL